MPHIIFAGRRILLLCLTIIGICVPRMLFELAFHMNCPICLVLSGVTFTFFSISLLHLNFLIQTTPVDRPLWAPRPKMKKWKAYRQKLLKQKAEKENNRR